MWSNDLGTTEISFVIIATPAVFVKRNVCIFPVFLGNLLPEGVCFIKHFWRYAFLFAIGGCSYMGLELLWRGWSHGSMFLAGGSCFLLLGKLNRTQPRLSLPFRALTGAGIITGVELLTGLLANRSYQVWDYRKMPMNYHGQICLPFCLLWVPISIGAMVLYDALDRKIPPVG